MPLKRKRTKYQIAQKRAASYCKNPTSAKRESRDKAIAAYKKSAEKAGKKASEISKTVSRLKSCKRK